MLPIQRRQVLYDYLARRGGGSIKELSDQLGVSEMTIRRDLELLEQQGDVVRSHGGAIIVDKPVSEPALRDKQARNADVKEKLAAYAAERFVSDGDVLVLHTISTDANDERIRCPPKTEEVASQHTVISSGGVLREPSGIGCLGN